MIPHSAIRSSLYGVLFLFLLILPGPAQANSVNPSAAEEAIRILTERMQASAATQQAEFEASTIAAFYAAREFRPLWHRPGLAIALVQAVEKSAEHGLTPEDYGLQALKAAAAEADTQSSDGIARLDLQATRSLVHLVHDLHFGKVNAEKLEPNWAFKESDPQAETLGLLSEAKTPTDIAGIVDAAAPQHYFYAAMKASLARYRQIAAAGGWLAFPAGDTLKPGMQDNRVPLLRARLAATADYVPGPVADPNSYDPALEAAVKTFQARHGLDTDGAVGSKTRAALNVPVQDRIDQIRANLERGRWVMRNLGPDLVIVNIAGFELFLFENNQRVWKTKVIVGRTYRKTPVFRAKIEYLVLNPTWTVPPTILRKDKLPILAKDVDYLARNNMVVYDAGGREIDPTTVDWQHDPKRFSYQIVQQPGDDNALGRIKFMFPNRFFVFLHDTPSRELFDRSQRTFSSGCIRMENPLELAARLLGAQGWTRESIEQAIATGNTQTVVLKKQLPILIMYWTVHPQADGSIRFFPDIYDRDGAVLKALDRPTA